MSSSREQPPKVAASAAGLGDVRSLYRQCLASEEKWTRRSIDRLKRELVRELTFDGLAFAVFGSQKPGSAAPDSELAARHRLLLAMFREMKSANDRLRLFAQWIRAELEVEPEDSLGGEVASRVSSDAAKRVSRVPFNDLYYGKLVRIWLPYSERLLEDAKRLEASKPRNLQQSLQALGYDPAAMAVLVDKSWRSPVEFTCEWLATRGGIRMVKAKKDADIGRTLRNAYSRVFGEGAPRLLKCVFCAKPAVGEFYAQDCLSAFHCEDHQAERLPSPSSEAWVDDAGRRWWRSGDTILCESSSTGGPR